MKKLLTILSAVLVLSASAFAEDFYPGWQFGIKGGASYTRGAFGVKPTISYPTVDLTAGYQFTPVFTLRGEVSGYKAKSAVASEKTWAFNYVEGDIEALVDICNIFNARMTRTLNPYIFAGPGLNVRFNNKDGEAYKSNAAYYWEKPIVALAVRAGAGLDIRLSNSVRLSLEYAISGLPNAFNSVDDKTLAGKNIAIPNFDLNMSGLIGLKFTFGQAKKMKAAALAAAAAAKAEADRLAAEAAAKAAAEAAAREAAEKAAAEKAAAERAAAEAAAREAAAKAAAARAALLKDAQNYGFDENGKNTNLFVIGRSNLLKGAKEQAKNIAEFLKAHPEAQIVLSGYADRETGTAAGNYKLSENRAKNLVKAIVKNGANESQIATDWWGDTKRIAEKAADNRAAQAVIK